MSGEDTRQEGGYLNVSSIHFPFLFKSQIISSGKTAELSIERDNKLSLSLILNCKPIAGFIY